MALDDATSMRLASMVKRLETRYKRQSALLRETKLAIEELEKVISLDDRQMDIEDNASGRSSELPPPEPPARSRRR